MVKPIEQKMILKIFDEGVDFLEGRKRKCATYAQGARTYSLNYYSFEIDCSCSYGVID